MLINKAITKGRVNHFLKQKNCFDLRNQSLKDVEKSVVMAISETYLGPCQMCTMRFFAKIVFSRSFKSSKHLSAFRVKAHGGDET